MKRILLINPWIYDFAAYDLWMKPMGLLSLGAILRNNGFDINFIDCLDPHGVDPGTPSAARLPKRKPSGRGHFLKDRVPKPKTLGNIRRHYHRFGISTERFQTLLENQPRPDLVMVTSMMTYWYQGVIEAIATVRKTFPGAPVILGGNYASLCPDHARKNSGADDIVEGEGEYALTALVRKYLHTDVTLPSDLTQLDALPYPAFDLIDKVEQIPLLASRGCPFKCTYCASGILNRMPFRHREPSLVVDEIEYWHRRFGVRHFAFYDDALLIDAEGSIVPMLRQLIDRKLSCHFHCPNGLHLQEVTPELACLIYHAGFKTMRFGFETADIERQAQTGGKVRTDHLAKAARCLHEAGYAPQEIGVYLLCGLPGQQPSEIRMSIELVQSVGCRPILAEYSPIPGTALWKDAVESSPWNIAEEPLFHNNTLLPCRAPELTDEVYDDLKRLTRLPL